MFCDLAPTCKANIMVLLSLPDISGRLSILEDIAMVFVTDTEVIQLIQLGKALTDSQRCMTDWDPQEKDYVSSENKQCSQMYRG